MSQNNTQMRFDDLSISVEEVSTIEPHPDNPRVHPESSIERLQESMREFGWTNPILLSEEGYILAGERRYKAAKDKGQEEVPVIRLPLKGEKAKSYMIADNRLAEDSYWDSDELLSNFEDIIEEGFDLSLTGFEQYEFEGFFDKKRQEDKNSDEEKPPEFDEESIETDYKCPDCGYEWSGSPK